MKFETNPDDLIHAPRNVVKRGNREIATGGLTKREYFAIQMYCSAKLFSVSEAIRRADELIEELNKK